MEIKLAEQKKVINPSRGKVVIDPNPIRVIEMLDIDGNVIDPRTKRIIKFNTDK